VKKVVVVGVGALGSHVVQFLRNEAEIKVIDFDKVEQKNTLSQFHARNSAGKSKVQSLQQAMSFLWGTKIEVNPHKLVGDNARQLLGGADLILDCLDNGDARRVVQGFVRENNIACLHGALAADGALGRVVWDEDFRIDDSAAGVATCEDGAHLPFIGIAACYLARAAQEYLSSGKKLGFQVYPKGSATRI
jgi:molybdopterin/thiamine biosynthesis adenylyltransferase